MFCSIVLRVSIESDAPASTRSGLLAHEPGATSWPETRQCSSQQPWRSEDCRLRTGTDLHLQHCSDSRCKWNKKTVTGNYVFYWPLSPLLLCYFIFTLFLCSSGGNTLVPSSWGAAEFCLYVLSGHVECWLHLCGALPLEVRMITVCEHYTGSLSLLDVCFFI